MRLSLPVISFIAIAALVTPAQADTVTVAAETAFADDSGASENVKRECDLQGRLPKYIKDYAKKHTKVEITREDLDSVAGKVLYLTFDHVYAPGGGGYSGAKSVSVEGELKEDGEVIGSFTVDRAALFAMVPGTCAMLKRAAKKLGEDIGVWLAAPEMDSMLGDAAS